MSLEHVPDQHGFPVTMATDDGFPVTHDDADTQPTRETSFSQTNAHAIPVYERAAANHITRSNSVSSTQMLVGRRPGRKYIVLSCPSTWNGATNTLGFQVSDNRNAIDTNSGFQVNPGDTVEIDTEAPVWVGVLSGNTAGVIQWVETFNPMTEHLGL